MAVLPNTTSSTDSLLLILLLYLMQYLLKVVHELKTIFEVPSDVVECTGASSRLETCRWLFHGQSDVNSQSRSCFKGYCIYLINIIKKTFNGQSSCFYKKHYIAQHIVTHYLYTFY